MVVGGGLIQFRNGPVLASAAATNSKHRPKFSAASRSSAARRGRWLGGRLCIFGHPSSTYPGPGMDRGHFKLFSDTKHIPSQSSGGFILQRGPSRFWWDEPSNAPTSPPPPRPPQSQQRRGKGWGGGGGRIRLSLGSANEEAFWVCMSIPALPAGPSPSSPVAPPPSTPKRL